MARRPRSQYCDPAGPLRDENSNDLMKFLTHSEARRQFAHQGLHLGLAVCKLAARLIPCLVIQLALAWDEKTAFMAVFSCAKDLSHR